MNKKTLINIGLGLLAITLLVVLLPGASAAAAHPSTCADVTTQATPSTLGSRYWFVTDASQSQPSTTSGCPGAGQALRERGFGGSITLRCWEATTGAAPPAAPSTVTIYAQPDNAQSGTPATSPIWSTSFSGSCTSSSTATFFCTNNGLSGGTVRQGLVRFVIEAQKGGVGSYDVFSDTGNAGAGFSEGSAVFRCQPQVQTFTDSIDGTTSPTKYIGGHFIRSSIGTQQDYSPASLGNLMLGCSSSNNNAGAVSFSSSTVTIDTTLQGSPSTWPDDCTLTQNITITRTSAIPTFFPSGSVIYNTWNTTINPLNGAISNVNGLNVALQRTAKVLDRTLSSSACSVNSVLVNRGDTNGFSCTWKNAQGNNEPTSQPYRAYATNDGFRDETGFTHVDSTLLTSSIATWTGTAKTTAPTSSSLAYHQEIDEFAVGHVGDDSFLWNWGNTTGQFDVSSRGTFDGINISKTSLGTNTSAFLIGADVEFARAKGLRNASGVFQSGVSVSCQRTRPDMTTEGAVTMGNTDGSGNSPEQQFQVLAPAGTWTMICTATWSGNTATYAISFFHQSSFTADTIMGVKWNTTFVPSNQTFLVNISAIIRVYDSTTDSIVSSFPDDPPKLLVQNYNAATSRYEDGTIISRGLMTRDDGVGSAAFYYQFWTTADNLRDDFAFVHANLTGRAFLGVEGFALQPAGNFSVFGNITVYGNATVTGSVNGSSFFGDGGNLTNITGGSSFTPAQSQLVIEMASFFGTPMMTVFPVLVMLLIGLVGLGINKRLPLLFMGFIDLFMVFMAASSVTAYSALGFDFAKIAATLLLATTLITFIKAFISTGTNSKQKVV